MTKQNPLDFDISSNITMLSKPSSRPVSKASLLFVLCLSILYETVLMAGNEAGCSPQHLHLSLGPGATDITVMWQTASRCESELHFSAGPDTSLGQMVEEVVTLTSADAGGNSSLGYMHTALLKNLQANTTYFYRPQPKDSFSSALYNFKTAPSGNTWQSKLLLVADPTLQLGASSALFKDIESHSFTALLVNPPHSSATEKQDQFLSSNMEYLADIPLMVAPQGRGVPGMKGVGLSQEARPLWSSHDLGLVHLVIYSPHLSLSDDTADLAKAQRDFLVNDLTQVNAHRSVTPWVVAMGSLSLYCAQAQPAADCTTNSSLVRRAYEDLFYHFAVDLVIAAGPTAYERTWPQYKGVTVEASYSQPRAPVEVLLGSGSVADDSNSTVEWLARTVPITSSTYARVTIINATHLQWELVDSMGANVIDTFTLAQASHGNFSLANLPHNVSHMINQTIIAMGGKPGTYDFISGSTAGGEGGEGLSKYSLWIGLGTIAGVLVCVLGLTTLRSCVRRQRAGRRWQQMDRNADGADLYSVNSDDDDDNDFEIDVRTDKQRSKLLTSY